MYLTFNCRTLAMIILKASFCVYFFFSAFKHFVLYISSLFNLFWMILVIFTEISKYSIKTFYSFIKKLIHLFSSNFFLHILICGRNMRNGLFFSARLLPIKNLKSGLPKGNILDITVLLTPILFIKSFTLPKLLFFNFSVIDVIKIFGSFLYHFLK